ncbi:MAG: glycosyltransferase family 4 protein [Cyanobium sp.]
MKLLFVAPSAYLLGGVQDWLADLVAGQRALGVEVSVAVPDDAVHRLEPYAERYPALRPLPFRNRSGDGWGRIAALKDLLRRYPEHLVAGVNIAALYPAVRSLRRQGQFQGKVVMTLHALEAEYFADLRQQRDLLDAVVVTNRLSGALAQNLGGMDPQRVLYAPYGVEMPAVAAPSAPTPPAEPGPLELVWVGRLENEQKRVGDLRAILVALDTAGARYRLTIAGDGPERQTLEQALSPWRERGVVRLTGAITRACLQREVYGPGRVLLITSAWETGPIVAWEAMAAGMAVVSSCYLGSGLEQSLCDGRTALLYPVGNAAAAAAQLFRLRDRILLAELATAGGEMVRGRYTREASLAAWMEAFSSVAALPPLPKPAAAAAPDPAGGLDRLLGPAAAHGLRGLLGRRFRHSEAGSEWPHSGHPPGDGNHLHHHALRLDLHG